MNKMNKVKSVGQFFSGVYFDHPIAVISNENVGFNVKKEDIEELKLHSQVQSVRWITSFMPQKSGLYTFKSRDFINIYIEEELVNEKEIYLESLRIYKLVIACYGNDKLSQEELLKLDIEVLLNGKIEELDENCFSIPEKISFDELSGINVEDELLDTDDDGIYDEWEINGYTVIGGVVKEWDEAYAEQGYKKFVSNPYESHTAGDPYSDLEKASGALDKSIDKSAWDPLVAAYPSVSVGIERLIISNNRSFSVSEGNTISKSVSSSVGTTNTVSIGTKAEIGLFNISASVSADYSHTSTQTVDKTSTQGQNWGEDLNIKEGESAYINANVRYHNRGTAPIYNLKPTVNFILDGDTISTVTAQSNQISLSLGPGKTYPRRNHNAIAFNTVDEFNAVPIPINLNQLNKLQEGGIIKLETTQYKGEFLKRNSDGGQVLNAGNEWAYYMPQIENMTAGIIVSLPKEGETIERRVAARGFDPNDLTPELTLGEALKKAYANYFKEDSEWIFVSDKTGNEYNLNPLIVHIVFDEDTAKLIAKEMDLGPDTIYDIKIRPGMNIQIGAPIVYDMFDDNETKLSWEGSYELEDGVLKIANSLVTCTGLENEITLPGHTYLVSMDVKQSDTDIFAISANGEPEYTENLTIGDTYTRIHAVFDGNKIGQLNNIVLGSLTDAYIDNFSLHKLS